jgi:hypothetical protein
MKIPDRALVELRALYNDIQVTTAKYNLFLRGCALSLGVEGDQTFILETGEFIPNEPTQPETKP